jgi:hypothetical protein
MLNEGSPERAADLIAALQQARRTAMFGDVGRARGDKSPDRQFGDWRIVVSAWLLVVVS